MNNNREKDLGFLARLSQLINEYSLEGRSNTPDFILAEYLELCLQAFGLTMKQRDKWYSAGELHTIQQDDTNSAPVVGH